VRDTQRIIPATEVERTERAWLDAVSQTDPISRDIETTPANRGLAETRA